MANCLLVCFAWLAHDTALILSQYTQLSTKNYYRERLQGTYCLLGISVAQVHITILAVCQAAQYEILGQKSMVIDLTVEAAG